MDRVKQYRDELLTLKEVVEILQITVSALRSRIQRGQIKAKHPSPKVTYILRRDLNAYLGINDSDVQD